MRCDYDHVKKPACGGPISFRVRNYFIKARDRQRGRDLYLCDVHGPYYKGLHPFERVEPRKKDRK